MLKIKMNEKDWIQSVLYFFISYIIHIGAKVHSYVTKFEGKDVVLKIW